MNILVTSAILISIAGILSVGTGVFFIVGDHPFHREGGYSEEYEMTREELKAINPNLVSWSMHVSDQVGSVSMGWGLFIIALAWLGIAKGNKNSWYVLWIAGIPTLIISTFGELIQFGTIDEGSLLSMVVFGIFVAGMIIPIRRFREN